ncbi:MAG: NTP transferase domain-containing protein [Candidatus Limnocylindrales bacterium]|nr:NTP transferase domain-containing protein [Candidatus Limnocylindrales bacterium]
MTVAACILASSADTALRDVAGTPNVRRLVDLAWAGGALPVIVVSPDPQGAVALALAGTPSVLAAPAPDAGTAGQLARAMELACREVDATDAALLWPARMGWLDAETVTSLIEAHGAERDTLLRPAFRAAPGWPILLPVGRLPALHALSADLVPEEISEALAAALPSRTVDLGDPGIVHSIETAPADLPPFEGPPEPAADRHHEWGALVADGPDEAPEPPTARD